MHQRDHSQMYAIKHTQGQCTLDIVALRGNSIGAEILQKDSPFEETIHYLSLINHHTGLFWNIPV